MESRSFFFPANLDSIKQLVVPLPEKPQVTISRKPVYSIDSVDMPYSYESRYLLNQQQLKDQKYRQSLYSRQKRWQDEQSLLIDSNRYMKPTFELLMHQSELNVREIVLPSKAVTPYYSDWLTVSLFLSMILFSLIHHFNGKYLNTLFKSIISYPAAARLYREQNISQKTGSLVMEFFYLFVFSLFAYQVVKFQSTALPYSGFYLFLFCTGAVFLYFLLKNSLYSLVGFISETQPQTHEYLFNLRNYNKVLAVLLLPMICLIAWAPVYSPAAFMVTGLGLALLMYAMTLQRGILILLKNQFSVFYLFLYLCTLEILPLLLFIKVI